MRLRIAVYAEGGGELGRSSAWIRPGDELADVDLGPAHVLVQRLIERDCRIPRGALVFIEPLRLPHRLPRGSDLLSKRLLQQLLAWPTMERQPDAVVLCIDEDGDKNRRSTIQTLLTEWYETPPVVLALAVREFESWLIAHGAAVKEMLELDASLPAHPETLEPRQAKTILGECMRACNRGLQDREYRREIANHCDLDHVGNCCPAFGTFRKDLRSTLISLGGAF